MKYIKRFEVEAGSAEGMWYKIVVKFRGKVVDVFESPTMFEALVAFFNAGYEGEV